MKKRVTLILLGALLPALIVLGQDPVIVTGAMSSGSTAKMRVMGSVKIEPQGKVINNGVLNLRKGVVFKSNDLADGILANYNSVDFDGSSASDVLLDKTFTRAGWYYMAVPFPVSTIVDNTEIMSGRDGSMGLGSAYLLKEYDGATRATSGKASSWKTPANGFVPGVGYSFQLSSGRKTHEIKFIASSIDGLYPGEKPLSIPHYTSSAPGLTQLSFGWNYVANTHTSSFTLNKENTEYRGGAQFFDAVGQTYVNVDLTTSGNNDSRILPPFTAVYVQSTTDGQFFTYKSSGISSSEDPALRSDGSNINQFKLKISSDQNGYYDYTDISVGNEFVAGYDFNEDIPKIFSPQEEAPQLWSFSSGGEDMTVNKLPEPSSGSIDLCYSVGKFGNYTISLDKDLMKDYNELWLLDKVTNTQVDLKKTSYSFKAWDKGTSKSRFVLRVSNSVTAISDVASSPVQIYTFNNVCYVKGAQAGDQVMIYDISGRTISNETASGGEYAAKLPMRGFYIVKVTGSVNQTAKVNN